MSSLLRKLFNPSSVSRILLVITITTLLILVLSSSTIALAGPDAIGP
jgi:hypothetical protein